MRAFGGGTAVVAYAPYAGQSLTFTVTSGIAQSSFPTQVVANVLGGSPGSRIFVSDLVGVFASSNAGVSFSVFKAGLVATGLALSADETTLFIATPLALWSAPAACALPCASVTSIAALAASANTQFRGLALAPCRAGTTGIYCAPCAANTYSAAAAGSACTACPARSASTSGASSCACTANSYSNGLAGAALVCTACPVGSSSAANSAACVCADAWATWNATSHACIYVSASATPTPSQTPSTSTTLTSTPTQTPTPTSTQTSTGTPSGTATPSGTPTPTPTMTPSNVGALAQARPQPARTRTYTSANTPLP